MIKGRPPKDDDAKVTRVPMQQGWIDVVNAPYEGERPKLPGRLPAATKSWWAVLSAMPHCALWSAADWQFALDTARIHAAFAHGDMVRAAELRIREGQMGTTYEARRNLRIRYVDPVAPGADAQREDSSEVTDFQAERRKRVTASAG